MVDKYSEGTDLISAVRFIESRLCVVLTTPMPTTRIVVRVGDPPVEAEGSSFVNAVHALRQKLRAQGLPS